MQIRLINMTAAMLFSSILLAQNSLRIHYTDGTLQQIPVVEIDSITLVEGNAEFEQVSLTGDWFWGSQEAGYYELLTLNKDRTYTGYDSFFSEGFDMQTFGWYFQHGPLLTLQSNGFGYRRAYHWLITELSENSLSVMTKMGNFTYYRLQPEVYHLKIGGTPLKCEDGETFIFADGVIIQIRENSLYGIASGISYVLKKTSTTGSIHAYKVIVE